MNSFVSVFYLFVGSSLLYSRGDALSCNMCNTLMPANGGYASACAANPEFHAMPCKEVDTTYCLKIDGTYIVQNNSSRKASDQKYTVTGVQRECASPYFSRLFVEAPITGDGDCVEVDRKDVSGSLTSPGGTANPDGTFPIMSFKGTVCFCKGDSCNKASGLAVGAATLLMGLAALILT